MTIMRGEVRRGCGDERTIAGFDLKTIVQISISAAQEGDCTGDAISGKKEGAPGFALADVNPLVCARSLERGLIATEDDVPEGHGRCAAREEGAVLQKERGQPTVDFKDVIHDASLAAGEQSWMQKGEAEERRWGGPEIEEKTLEGH